MKPQIQLRDGGSWMRPWPNTAEASRMSTPRTDARVVAFMMTPSLIVRGYRRRSTGARAAFPFPLCRHAGHAARRAARTHLRPYKSPFSARVTASGRDVRHGLRRCELRGHRSRATMDSVVILEYGEARRRAREFVAAKYLRVCVDTSGARRHVSRQTTRHSVATSTQARSRQYVVGAAAVRFRCRWRAPRRHAWACGRTPPPAHCGAGGMRTRGS